MRIDKTGPRTWAVAAVVALSVFDPGSVIRWGLYIGIAVWLTGAPSRFRVDRVAFAVIAMVAWQYATTTWAVNSAALTVTHTAAILGATFLFARDAIRSREQLRFVAWGYVLASLATTVRLVIGSSAVDVQTGRYTLEGINANYLAYALCGALAVVVVLWPGSGNRERFVLVVSAMSIAYGFALTGTRGAALGAACLITWLVICAAVKRPPLVPLVIVASATAVIITSGIFDERIRALEFGGRVTGDWSNRLYLWPVARDLWAESWLLGRGPQAMRASNPVGDAHSVFLEIGSAQGAIGVILFVLFMVAALHFGTRGAPSRMRGILVGVFISTMTPAYLSGAWEAAPAAMMLVLIFSKIGAPSREALTPVAVSTTPARIAV